MRIKLLAAAAVTVLLVATAAVIFSCQDGATEPTGPIEMRSGEVGIWGLVTNSETHDPIIDAYVVWWCETCEAWIGDDAVDDIGRYDIDPPLPFSWSDHDGHDLKGEASHPGYNPGTQEIEDFDSGLIPYQRDFELVPGK